MVHQQEELMNDQHSRFREIFFEVYEHLPRQGPGNRSCAARALSLCPHLPPQPEMLDLGCGVGGQTLHLADLVPAGFILAIDNHAPSIDRLLATITQRGLSHRIRAKVGDISSTQLQAKRFDLIWSEGALYNIGIQKALDLCHEWLRPGGYLAFTDAIWRKENPPAEIKAGFDLDYPDMGTLEEDLSALHRCGFELIDHFTLPDEAWWDDFYTPMKSRIEVLQDHYACNPEVLAILEEISQEPVLHRRYSDFYAYEFFVARRKPTVQTSGK